MPDQSKSTLQPPESAREVVWRETFVSRFDSTEDAQAVRRFGDFLITLCYEGGYLGYGDRNLIAFQLDAAGADLVHLVAYLREVAEHPEHSEASRMEVALCHYATTWADRLQAMAEEVRQTVSAEERARGPKPSIEDEAARVLAELRRLLADALKLKLHSPEGALVGRAMMAVKDAVEILERGS
jgi:hypothetical protein